MTSTFSHSFSQGAPGGRYAATVTRDARRIADAQQLRARSFGVKPQGDVSDADGFDDICTHVLIEERETGRLACCFRFLPLNSGLDVPRSYSYQFYGLGAVASYPEPMLEIGRFCVDPELRDPDVLRIAWGALTRYVDAHGVGMLFGCASFSGTEPTCYTDSLALLKDRYLAPRRWSPTVKAPDVVRYAQELRDHAPDPEAALRAMPSLLRTYLAMGGWVSDHAVVDHQLNTLHVFTALEVATIPAARKRQLRAAAAHVTGP